MTRPKKNKEAEVPVEAKVSEDPSLERYNAVLKKLEEEYLWWHHIAENGAVPDKQPLPPRQKQKLHKTSSKPLKRILMPAEEYLGGTPKKYDDYAKLENEMFPDLFRDVFDNDIASLYEAIASSKGAGLYSNLMTAALQQKELEKKRRLAKLPESHSKDLTGNKPDLASYMVDILTKSFMAIKDEKDNKQPSKKTPTSNTSSLDKKNDKLIVRKTLKSVESNTIKEIKKTVKKENETKSETVKKTKGKKNENDE